jgi:hypothetical protein
MSQKWKWIDSGKPVSVTVRSAKELTASPLKFAPLQPDCFRFQSGTDGWTIDQIYDTWAKTKKKLGVFTWPYGTYGFTLANSQGVALAADAQPLVLDPKTLPLTTPAQTGAVASCDIFLVSPDLSSRAGWQGINGYSLDLHRLITFPCGEPKPLNQAWFAQFQIALDNPASKSPTILAETNASTGAFLFHPIAYNQTYHFSVLLGLNSSRKYKGRTVQHVIVRLTTPYPAGAVGAPAGMGECWLPKGKWLIGNVCPVA